MSICQIKKTHSSWLLSFFLMMALSSCSTPPVVVDKSDRKINNSWGNIPLRFYEKDEKGNPAAHLFFDIDSKIQNFTADHKTNLPINYLVTTPEDSEVAYELDLLSGKLYRDRNYCKQDDVWESYTGTVHRPNFTLGIIPRVFDKKMKPFKVLVISKKEVIEPFKKNPEYFDKVRIIGSVVVQECEYYPCNYKDRWASKQILIGVSERDQSGSSIESFKDLKNKIDWKYAKAFLENADGVHRMASRSFPRYKLASELNLKDSFDFFKKNSEVIDTARLNSLKEWRKGCMALYDDFYLKSEEVRKDKEEGQRKFIELFRQFHAAKGKEFRACSKIVRPANILQDQRRHWFFAHIQAFELLVESGYYYSCTNGAWIYNPKNADGSFYVDQNKELSRCRGKMLEKGLVDVFNGLHLLKNSTNQTYRFVEYDNKSGGSHQFLYSWIYDKSSNQNCSDQKSMKAQTRYELFPSDVSWEEFSAEKPRTVR